MATHYPIDRFIDKVFHADCRQLLARMPDESVNAIVADPMYFVASSKSVNVIYDWGAEPGRGRAKDFWDYHRDVYTECRRVLQSKGALAWAMGSKHAAHFDEWFGDHRKWAFTRQYNKGVQAFGHIWMCQNKEQQRIRFPDADALLEFEPKASSRRKPHPCPKSEVEMEFMVHHLTNPGDIVLDCFAGTGTTLVAAKKLGRHWIGCDLSMNYCRYAKLRLSKVA